MMFALLALLPVLWWLARKVDRQREEIEDLRSRLEDDDDDDEDDD